MSPKQEPVTLDAPMPSGVREDLETIRTRWKAGYVTHVAAGFLLDLVDALDGQATALIAERRKPPRARRAR